MGAAAGLRRDAVPVLYLPGSPVLVRRCGVPGERPDRARLYSWRLLERRQPVAVSWVASHSWPGSTGVPSSWNCGRDCEVAGQRQLGLRRPAGSTPGQWTPAVSAKELLDGSALGTAALAPWGALHLHRNDLGPDIRRPSSSQLNRRTSGVVQLHQPALGDLPSRTPDCL